MFVHSEHFQPSLIFEGKAKQPTFRVDIICSSTRAIYALLTGWKYWPCTNTLAYFAREYIYSTMGKLQLTGGTLGRVFNCRNGCTNTVHLSWFEAKLSDLKLKTRPEQLFGSLPIDIELPDSIVTSSFHFTIKPDWLDSNPFVYLFHDWKKKKDFLLLLCLSMFVLISLQCFIFLAGYSDEMTCISDVVKLFYV